MRKFWMIMYNVCFRTIPDFLVGGRLRNYAVRKFLSECGEDIDIGYGCRIHKNTCLGNHSGIGRMSEITNGVKIGENVMIGPDVYMCTDNHNFESTEIPMRLQGFRPRKEIIIGDDVWIGAKVIILPGVSIGTGCVIGAGSVVTKSIPPWTVAAGNPAKVIKNRK